MNCDAAGQAARELGAEVRIVKKTSPEYASKNDPLPCPSVLVNGEVIVRNDIVTYETLKTSIRSSGKEGMR